MRTESIYIDIRSLYLLCDIEGQTRYSVNPALKGLFTKLQAENSAVRYEFSVFGREGEFTNTQRQYRIAHTQWGIAFQQITEEFNTLKNSSIAPLTLLSFLELDANPDLFPELPCDIKPLFISSDLAYLSAAERAGYITAQTYLGGELDSADKKKLKAACQRTDITSLFLSSDIDSTLLLIDRTLFHERTVLNDDLITVFSDLNTAHPDKNKKFMLLTARNSEEIKYELKLSYRLLLDDMQALFLAFLDQKNAFFLKYIILALGDSDLSAPHLISPEIGVKETHTIFEKDSFFYRPASQFRQPDPWHPHLYLPKIRKLALIAMPFIGCLPAVCTADPYAKSTCLNNLIKPGQLIAHFDDCSQVIDDIRTKMPDVFVVRVYTPGAFSLDLTEILRSWLLTNASPVDSDFFDAILNSGPFVRIPSAEAIDEFVAVETDELIKTPFSA